MSNKFRFAAAVALTGLMPFAARAGMTETVLYNFDGTHGDLPWGITADKNGVLYGATGKGGEFNLGTAFKFESGTLTVLHDFKGRADSAYPHAGVTVSRKGDVFGTTCGGDTPADIGTVFEVLTNGNEKKLHVFKKRAKDGNCPEGELVLGPDKAYYGTSTGGGAFNHGTVFRISPKGDFSVIYSFTDESDGNFPASKLVSDDAGNFYGTTTYGGEFGVGTVFSVTSSGAEHVIYSFGGVDGDGAMPQAGVIADKAGNLYGTTVSGGVSDNGALFKIAPDGTEILLHSFNDFVDGLWPNSHLLMDKAGNIYGTVLEGENNHGSIFEFTAAGELITLFQFGSGAVGQHPAGDLYMDKQGAIYGTTQTGGDGGVGIIYKLTPQ